MKNMNVEGSDIWVPALRGFLALVVILLALDAMLIDTSIFYILLNPLAWGIAIVDGVSMGNKGCPCGIRQGEEVIQQL